MNDQRTFAGVIYAEGDIRGAVSKSAFQAGSLYQAQGRVLSFKRENETLISSQVIGNERHPYEQSIVIERAAGVVNIDGSCSCPVGFNCKHVVAALVQGLAEAKSARTMPALPAVRRPASKPEVTTPPPAAVPPPLPHELASWLDDLVRARAMAEEAYPNTISQRLIYVLKPVGRGARTAQLGVVPTSVRLLKDGRFSEGARPYPAETALSGAPGKFLRPSDIRILHGLLQTRREYYTNDLLLAREAGVEILERILETGRARWQSVTGPVLAAGPTRSGTIAWQSSDGETMRPVLEAGDGVTVLNATPPRYVDAVAGLIGAIETGLAPKIAATLLDSPPVPAGHIDVFTAALSRRAPDLVDIAPRPPGPPEIITLPPVGRLRLFSAQLPAPSAAPFSHYYGYAAPLETVGLARLSFRYGSTIVAGSETRPHLTRIHDGRLFEVRRDAAAESALRAALASRDFVPVASLRRGVPPAHAQDLVPAGDAMAWFDAAYHDIPELAAAGWEIEIAEDFPFQLVRGDSAFNAEVRETTGIDWFEFELGMVIDGERIDLIGPIVALIGSSSFDFDLIRVREAEDEPVYLPLGDGRVLAVPAARIASVVAAIRELATGDALAGGTLRLRPADAADLAAFETATAASGVVWRGGERLRDMGRKLGASGIPEAALPSTFLATLRPYQAQGVSWLAFLRDVGFGGILADDMGLGKTAQALALIAIEKAAGRLDHPALVIAPTSLMANWRREAERFAPDLRVLTLQGLDRKTRFGAIATSDLVLTTYPLIARDHAVLGETPWHLLLLDEAQTIKNPDATTTKLIAGIEARHRFCLSGTPLENHLGELWSLFSFVMPGFLGDRPSFTRTWRTPIEKGGDGARAGRLARRVRPFLLRRTKEEVAKDLPPKTEIVERVEFQQGQRDIYEAIRLSMHDKVRDAIASKGFARSRIVILDALLKMRQACCDPRLLKATPKAAAKAGSAKLERLDEMLTELLAENRKILVFSQFTSMLALIRARLEASGTAYSLLTGDTRDRETEIRRFQDGPIPVFLVSLKAGGTGLNLTAADTVILYDPWWNPAVEEQAIDRAHRIGQDKPVFVHKLVATRTIEEKMETLKQKKRALAESLFDADGAPTLAMTEADLDLLFAPA